MACLLVVTIPISVLVALFGRDHHGLLGAGRTVTTTGLTLMLALSTLAAIGGLLHAFRVPVARTISGIGLGGLVAMAALLTVADPAVGLFALGWFGWLGLRLLVPKEAPPSAEDTENSLVDTFHRVEWSLSIVALLLILGAVGYQLMFSGWVIAAVLTSGLMATVSSILAELSTWRKQLRSPGFWIEWGAFAAAGTWLGWGTSGLVVAIAARQTVILARRALVEKQAQRLLEYLFQRPAQLFLLSFGTLIALGAVVLSFPVCSASGQGIHLADSIFIATSAVCVTGLTTVDLPTTFSSVGFGVILALVQIGGIGVITLSSFAVLLLSQRLGLRHESALGELMDQASPREVFRLVRFIVVTSLALEALGAAALALAFEPAASGRGDAWWRAIFHSVSAFCNAGFALQSDSLSSFRDNPWVLLPISLLVLLGGLGFPVLAALFWWLFRGRRLSLGARLTFIMSLVLTGFGLVLLVLLEWGHAFGSLSTGSKLLSAFFHTVTLRTAGFNTVDMASFRPATLLLMMAWMFIGGSTGSTAGGIKMTTVAVLVLHLVSLARGRDRVEVFNRMVPQAIVARAAAVAVLGLTVVVAGQLGDILFVIGTENQIQKVAEETRVVR